MAKTVKLTGADLAPSASPAPPRRSASKQRGETSSADLVPLQFKVEPEFAKAFKREALDRGLSLKDFMISLFNERAQ